MTQLVRRPGAVQGVPVDQSVAGTWRVYARIAGRTPAEITTVRGVPTPLTQISWEDPFGPKGASLSLPMVSVLDSWGVGELQWLGPDMDIDIAWDGALPKQYPFGQWVPSEDPDDWAFEPGPLIPARPTAHTRWRPTWRWEGFCPSIEAQKSSSANGTSVEAVGALRMLDGYLAKPEYPARPLPYEWAIGRQFLGKPALRLGKPQVAFPSWWTKTYHQTAGQAAYLVPVAVREGELWSGYLTRNTGQFNPALTGYVQTLLANMYTDRGRWTLDLMPGRVPLLAHRDIYSRSRVGFVRLSALDPGVDLNLRVDNSQSLGAVYGRTKTRTGLSYTGQQVSADGSSTSYKPLAELAQVAEQDTSGWLDRSKVRREIMLQATDGLEVDELLQVGQQHLARFADPGITGTITLATAGIMLGATEEDNEPIHHMLLRAGMSLVIPGLFGRKEVVLHITDAELDFEHGHITLTVDGKYRDALTIDEVRQRTRDALAVPRMMIGGEYQPPIPDQLIPWNYSEGSGFIPSGPLYSSKQLFDGMPNRIGFPWVEWTTDHPPSDPRWANSYIPLGPADLTNASKNWTGLVLANGEVDGIPVKLAQAGHIRLLQVAAYRADGSVADVEFHIGFYTVSGVNVNAMPIMGDADVAAVNTERGTTFLAGQRYPFFPNAWEKYNTDGTLLNPQTPVTSEGNGEIKRYGTYFDRPGHFPGDLADPATGLLVDEEGFDFDLTQVASTFDPYSVEGNWVNPLAGFSYVMIYCDTQGDDPVYFMGRLFRQEPSGDAG